MIEMLTAEQARTRSQEVARSKNDKLMKEVSSRINTAISQGVSTCLMTNHSAYEKNWIETILRSYGYEFFSSEKGKGDNVWSIKIVW